MSCDQGSVEAERHEIGEQGGGRQVEGVELLRVERPLHLGRLAQHGLRPVELLPGAARQGRQQRDRGVGSRGDLRQELGRADLTRGDGHIAAELGLPRQVRARVLVDDRPGLPGTLRLCSSNGHVAGIEEDAERGILAFRYWQLHRDRQAELRLYGSWRQSVGVGCVRGGAGCRSCR